MHFVLKLKVESAVSTLNIIHRFKSWKAYKLHVNASEVEYRWDFCEGESGFE